MAKILYVGDPHTQISNLADSAKLMGFVLTTAIEHEADEICLLGDLFHTHAIVRLEVLNFWNKWLAKLSVGRTVRVLVGNHDKTGDHSNKGSALSVFNDPKNPNLLIIEQMAEAGPMAYMAYEHDAELFVEEANRLAAGGCRVLVCHQSFSGSKFENGYFDPGGINPDLLNFDKIISGHIHLGQEFGKVWHPGTAMWLTSSDANQPKGLYLVDHDAETGEILSRTFFSTADVVTPIVSVQWNEGQPAPKVVEGSRTTVEMVGSSEWIAQARTELQGKAALKSTFTDTEKTKVRRTAEKLQDFIEQEFKLIPGVDKQKFVDYLKELGLVGQN